MNTDNTRFINRYARLTIEPPRGLLLSTAGEKRAWSGLIADLIALYREGKPLRLHFITKFKSASGAYGLEPFLTVVNAMKREKFITVISGRPAYKNRPSFPSTLIATEALEKMIKDLAQQTNPRIGCSHSMEAEEMTPILDDIRRTLCGDCDEISSVPKVQALLPHPNLNEWKTVLAAFNKINIRSTFTVTSCRPLNEIYFEPLGGNEYRIKTPGLIYFRTFNAMSVEDDSYSIHGRWYCPTISLMPSQLKIRQSMRINGEETVELDFKGLHFQLLRAEAGLPADTADPYQIYENQPIWSRSVVKQVALIAINCGSVQGIVGAMRKKWDAARNDPDHMLYGLEEKVKQNPEYETAAVIKALKERHKEIEHLFFNSAWKRLSRIDSEILHLVARTLVEKNIPAYFVHDSIIVAKQHKDLIEVVMANAYHVLTGQLPIITIK